jgi:hypothetical protein
VQNCIFPNTVSWGVKYNFRNSTIFDKAIVVKKNFLSSAIKASLLTYQHMKKKVTVFFFYIKANRTAFLILSHVGKTSLYCVISLVMSAVTGCEGGGMHNHGYHA